MFVFAKTRPLRLFVLFFLKKETSSSPCPVLVVAVVLVVLEL